MGYSVSGGTKKGLFVGAKKAACNGKYRPIMLHSIWQG